MERILALQTLTIESAANAGGGHSYVSTGCSGYSAQGCSAASTACSSNACSRTGFAQW